MSEKRIFITKMNGEHKFGDNNYILGRVSGVMMGLEIDRMDDGLQFGNQRKDGNRYLRAYCTEEEYQKFKEIVNSSYGRDVFNGLFEFDI